MESDKKDGGKRPYSRPELRIYGDIRELTATAGNTAQSDNPQYGAQKTKTA
jgi:hypothetical protein